ncbi:hypothetical protein HQ560_18670, partial [bacterium]|nr:hypothetical protein [bacterium]
VDLILFMTVRTGLRSVTRRVATLYESDGAGGHRLLYEWEPMTDSFHRVAEPHDVEGLRPYEEFVQRLVDENIVEAQAVRREVVAFHRERR